MTEATVRRWPIRTIAGAIAIFFGFLILAKFLWIARSILVITFLGVLFGLALSAGVDWLERRGVRRGLGAIFLTLTVLGMLVGIGVMIAPTLRQQFGELQEELPQSLDKIDQWMGRKTHQLAQTVSPASPQQARQQAARAQRSLREQLAAPLRSVGKFLFPFISTTFAAIAALILTIFIAIYIATEPHLYRSGLLHLVPHRGRKRAEEVLSHLEDSLRRWLIARLLAMLAIGVITTLLLMLLRVRAAVALGVVAGLLEFIPFFGPIVSALPAIGIALLDSPQKALWVVLVFVGIQQIEGNVLTPLLLENRVQIPPVLTVVSVAAMGAALGVPGMLIAEPLLVVALILVQMLYVEEVVGDEVAALSDSK